jgi:hypothetical protein
MRGGEEQRALQSFAAIHGGSPEKCRAGKRAGNRTKWSDRKYVARKCHPAREYYVGRNMQSGMPNKRNRDIERRTIGRCPEKCVIHEFVCPSPVHFSPACAFAGIIPLLFRRCNFPLLLASRTFREGMFSSIASTGHDKFPKYG